MSSAEERRAARRAAREAAAEYVSQTKIPGPSAIIELRQWGKYTEYI